MDLGSGRSVESGDQQQQQQAHHQQQQQQQQPPPSSQPISPHPTPISLLMPLQHPASNSLVLLAPHHEISAPKLKLLSTTPLSGNGGGKGDHGHHVAADQAREIVRHAVTTATVTETTTKPSSAKKGTVRYRECQKNHAASIGGHAIDGCHEFMPGGDDGSVDALRCAACDCHRNFHRREVEGEVVCDCKKLPKPSPLAAPFNSNNKMAPLPTPQSTTTPVSQLPPSSQLGQMAPLTMAALSAGGGGPTDSDDPDDGPGNSAGMMMSMRSPSAIKKRFRTKFTTEQKDQMCAFAEKVGWRIQKHDEAAVQEFCSSVGVKRHVLKVWMHNNKHTMGKKP